MALIHRIRMIGNAASQLLNTLLGGWSDESVSSRSWRLSLHSRRWGHADGYAEGYEAGRTKGMLEGAGVVSPSLASGGPRERA